MRKPTADEKVTCPDDTAKLKHTPQRVWEVREPGKPVVTWGILPQHTHDMIQTGFYGEIPNPNGEPCEQSDLPVRVVSG